MIYDVQIALYSQLSQIMSKSKVLYSPSSENEITIEGQENLLNNIAVIQHLIASSKDLKIVFMGKEKVNFLNDEMESMSRYGKLPTKIDIDLLYGKMENEGLFWVYKNKILDEILIKYTKIDKLVQDSKVL